jgi:predicted membrane protein (TIGR00267 family)
MEVEDALIPAISIGLISLFIVGALMGRISKRNILIAGLRMMLAGVITLAVVSILNPSHL